MENNRVSIVEFSIGIPTHHRRVKIKENIPVDMSLYDRIPGGISRALTECVSGQIVGRQL